MTRPLQYITRYASPGHGQPHWCVRVISHRVSKRFYDGDLGGVRKALVAAQAFRNRIAESLLPRGYRHQPHRSRAGFSYYEYWKGDHLRRFWVAGWQDNGRRRIRRFEITVARPFYEAKRLAKEWRERMIAQRP